MGILKELTKEYFKDIERGETSITFNTKEMVPVDLGGSVYWADRDLERIGGETRHEKHFSYEEIEGRKFGYGWRLPTMEEYFELCGKNIDRFDDDRRGHKSITFSLGGADFKTHSIEFKAFGYYNGNTDRCDGTGECGSTAAYLRLTSDISNMFTLTNEEGEEEEWKQLYVADVSLHRKQKKEKWRFFPDYWYFPIRLVKDK